MSADAPSQEQARWRGVGRVSRRLVGRRVRVRRNLPGESRRIVTVIGIMAQSMFPGGVQVEPGIDDLRFWHVGELEIEPADAPKERTTR